MFVSVYLMGFPLRTALLLELAALVEGEELAAKLRRAVENETRVDDEERETLLVALVELPEGLEELRGVLLREHEWRRSGARLVR